MTTTFKMRVLKPVWHQGKTVLPGQEIAVLAEQVFDLLGKAVLIDDTDLQRSPRHRASASSDSRRRQRRCRRIGPPAWPK